MEVAPLISAARRLIVDAGTIQRVTDESFVEYINEGLTYIVAQNPFTVTGRVEWQTSPNATSYHTLLNASSVALPQGARHIVFVIDVPALTETDGQVLNLEDPGWRVSTTPGAVRNWVRSANSTVGFYTYPAAPTGTILEVDCCLHPEQVLDAQDELDGLREEFTSVLIDYMVYRALAEDADNVANQGLSISYLDKANAVIAQVKEEDIARWNTRT